MRLFTMSLLALTLAMGQSGTATAQPPAHETGLRNIELRTDAMEPAPVIRIRPGISTVLTFDMKSARDPEERLHVELERAADFTRVDLGQSILRLVPSEALKPEERLRLSVRFENGAAPWAATFNLLVSVEQADRLVEVSWAPRPMEPSQAEVREAWAAVRQCQEALDQQRAPPGGMTALRLAEVLSEGGVVVRNVLRQSSGGREGGVEVKLLRTYRAERRVLIEVSLQARAPGPPWTARHASLSGQDGALLKIVSVWQESPVTADAPVRILVEAESNETLPPAPWALWLSDEEGGGRALVLGGIAFAPMGWSGARTTE